MMNSYVLRMVLVWKPNYADSVCRKVGEKLRRRALLAIIIHCWTKSARIAPLETLTDSYSWFLPRTQPYLNSVTRAPKSIPYTLLTEIGPVFIHWRVVYDILLICWSTAYFISFVELYPILTHCCVLPILFCCRVVPYLSTLSNYGLP